MSRRTRRIGVLPLVIVVLVSSQLPWPAAAASARPTGSTVRSDSAMEPEPSATSLVAAPTPTTLSPFQDTGWRYQVVSRGGGPADFMDPGFVDTSFLPGRGAFTSGGGCAVQGLGHTNWPANTDILLRKTIDVPANTTDIVVTGGIDNDTFVYWNGQLIGQSVGHEGCPGTTDFSYAVPVSTAVTGANILAIRGRDRGSEAYLDVRVTAVLNPLTTPVAAAGPDQSAVEGAVVTLDGTASADPNGAPLSYAWALTGRTGPPITLSSTTSPTPAFQATDDGTYRFTLTVSNGTLSATDEVVITVTNADPAISIQADPAYERSVALVTTTFTDPGVLDTHTATVTWGDGTAQESIPVAVQGSGWGTVVASHVYASAGSFTVTVKVTDDDGGSATGSVSGYQVVVPVALWSNSNATDASMEATSGAVTVEGLTHSNDDLRLRGGTKTFTGPTEFVRTVDAKGTTAIFNPSPVQTGVKQFPIRFPMADYRPGGRAAKEAGAAYHDMSASCGGKGTWQVNGSTLASGIYYANCAVKLNGNPIGGTITVAAEGDISVSGSGAFFDPYIDGLLFLSNSISTSAIRVDASGSTFFGYSFAERGQILLTGANDKFFCGILADRIDISSQNLRVHGSACTRPTRTAASPVVVPTLTLALDVDRADALPGSTLRHTATLRNIGATVVVPGVIGLENLGSQTVTVTGHDLHLEYLGVSDGAWHPMPGTVALTVRPNPFAGVTYPSGAERIDGTTVAAGALASWGYSAVVTLTSAQIGLLLDPARVAEIRAVSTFTLNPTTVPVRRLFRFGEDFSASLRGLGANATAARVTIIPPTGDAAAFAAPGTPALATVAPGDSVVVGRDSTVAGPAPRGATESDAAYLARLASFDGSLLIGTAFGRATGGIGPLLVGAATTQTTRHLPIVALDKTGPADLEPGTTADYALGLSNTGSVGASTIAVTDTVTGVGAIPVTGVPATLAAGASGTAHASYSVPSSSTAASLSDTGSVTWKDSANNAYGPVSDSLTTRLIAQRRLVVVKTDATSIDTSGQTVVDYDITLTNIGAQTITGVALSDQLDPYTTLVPSSVRTSQGTITTGSGPADIDIAVAVGSIPTGRTVSIGFRAAVTQAVPESMNGIANQATVTSDQLGPILSDDPEAPGAADPTRTQIVGTVPGGGGGGGGVVSRPSIGTATPADGTVVTEAVTITATIDPPAGFDIASWSIGYRPVGGTADTTIAAATVSTAGPVTATGTFDPTILRNGMYQVTIRAVASDGGVSTSTTNLIVDGNLKLGRYQTTYQDLSVGVGGLPMQVLRTYDSFDKTPGDFGIGWRVALSNFRVQVNKPLGYGGWVQEAVNCSFLFCTTRYHSTTAHIVTVIWPDGHSEIFDLAPLDGSTFYAPATAAAFRGRARATSKLEADGDTSLSFFGDGNLYGGGFGSGGVYDPQRFRMTAKDGTVYLLDRSVGLVSSTDRNGNTLTVTPAGVTSSNGPSIAFTRDPLGRISRISGPTSETIDYGYDASGDLRTVTEGTKVFTYTYNGNHDLLVSKSGGVPFQTLTYEDGRLATVTDSRGLTTTIDLDVAARQETVTSPSGRLVTVNGFDTFGNLLRTVEAFDGRTLTWRYAYDDAGRPKSSIDPLNHETKAEWDSEGNLRTFTDAAENSTRFTYGAFGNLLTQVAPDGTTVLTNTYDPSGNLLTSQRPGTPPSRYGYDNGRIATITDPTNRQVGLTYTPEGRVETVTEPDGRVRRYTYDPSGRTKTIVEQGGATTTFGYNGNGQLTSVTDALTRVHNYGYDAFDRITSDTDALHRSTTYVYDGDGRLAERDDRNGAVTTYTYDADGRLASKRLPGAVVTNYDYDPSGRLLRLADPDAVIEYTYDDAGNLTSQHTTGAGVASQPDVTLTYTYDVRDAPATVNGPGGTIRYTFDSRLRLDTVRDASDGLFDLTYDDRDRLAGFSRPNGVADSLTWNDTDELLNRRSTLNGASVASSTYTYDLGGRRRSLEDLVGLHVFTPDQRDRLTAATHPAATGLPAESYAYDDVGNRTSWPGSPTSAVGYDEADRLLRDGRFDYVYDFEGDLIRRTERATGGVTTYDWDADHKLQAVHLPDGSVSRYRYDPLGRRIEVADPARVTRYVYDGSNVALEYDVSNHLQVSYVTGLEAGAPFEAIVGGQRTYPLQDGLGTAVATTDQSGAVTSRYTYGAFGQPAGVSAGTYSFTGHQYDDRTGLYYARARYYDPGTGRFLSEDPIPSVNPYPYVDNDPVDLMDPSGAQPTIESSLRYASSTIYRGALGQIESQCCVELVKLAALALGGGANAMGAAGEAFVGNAIGVNHGGRVQVPGTNRFRIPDFNLGRNLVEVKNTKYLSLTRQLRDFVTIGNGNPVTIVTRAGTTLSGPLLDLMKTGAVRIIGCLPG